jgi:hypothetical protein
MNTTSRRVVAALLETGSNAGTAKRLMGRWKSEGPLRKFERAMTVTGFAIMISNKYKKFEPRMEGNRIIVDIVGNWRQGAWAKHDVGQIATYAGLNFAGLSAERDMFDFDHITVTLTLK